jgi:hypothetical protein
MADIFVSYAAEDRDRARQLAHALEERGWDVWWDREIPLGRLYDDAIEQALAEARCCIVLWSHTSIASEWVRSEASEAKRRGILVPIFLEAVDPPLAFRLVHGADLTTWEAGTPHEEFEHLTERVGELLAQTPRRSGRARVPISRRVLGDDRPGPRRWWWVAAAAALSLLIVGAFLTGAYRGGMTASTDTKLPAARHEPSGPAPAGPAHGPPAAQAPGTTPSVDPSDLTAALQQALMASGGQGSLGAMTLFELKELNVKLTFVSDEQAGALGILGLPPGAVVMAVDVGPALTAGLQAGDVITAIGGTPIKSAQDLRRALRGVGPGKTRYGIRRDGRDLTLDIDCPACTAS